MQGVPYQENIKLKFSFQFERKQSLSGSGARSGGPQKERRESMAAGGSRNVTAAKNSVSEQRLFS